MTKVNKSKPAKGTYTIEVEGLSCVLRKLDRKTYKIVHAKMTKAVQSGDESLIDCGQIILNSCWLSGDEALRDDKSDDNMEVNFSACQQALGMVEVVSGALKKN